MKRTWTIIGVADVARSLEWYQSLFGQPHAAPAHEDFGQITDTGVRPSRETGRRTQRQSQYRYRRIRTA